jgi:hypothetical protein
MADSWLRFAIARRQALAGFLPLAGLAFDLVRRVLAAAMVATVGACAVGPDFRAAFWSASPGPLRLWKY